MIHVEGMGWLGSALAFRLAADGVEFSWSDVDSPRCAWPASTGSVYPAGDDRSTVDLAGWRRWIADGVMPPGTVEEVDFVFRHRQPPHGGRYPFVDLGPARLAEPTAIAVDVPAIVTAARRTFAARRTDAAPDGVPVIRAHGFGNRLAHVIWGWSAGVRLDVPALFDQRGRRASFYSQAHRFQIVYAFVVPTRPGWWKAGSSMIRQTVPRELDAAAHLARWIEAWARLWPEVPVVEVESPVQGWRPSAGPDDTGRYEAGSVPPLGHSGVRWAPSIIEAAVKELSA